MRIEAVIVCKGFADILEQSIIHNQSIIDQLMIVTSHDDGDTKRVCKRHGVDFVETDAFTRRGDKFNKGLAINVGLANLSCADWMLQLDGDVLLPPHTRRFLENAELDTKAIHGIDRFNMTGWDAYQEWRRKGNPQYEWFCLINPPEGCSFGSRIVHYDYGGWMPIGFFQLWHADSGITRYPTKIDANAEHTDVLHAMKWPRPKRVLIPEVIAIHIQSEHQKFGANWKGRTAKPFGPDAVHFPPHPGPHPHPGPQPHPPYIK